MDGVRQEPMENIRDRIENNMIAFVRENPDSIREDIIKAVRGSGTTKVDVFKQIVDSEFLVRSGDGVKASPYRYRIPELPYMTEPAALIAA